MRLFPRPWEEAGPPIFPRTPEPMPTSSLLHAPPDIAIILGSFYALGRRLFKRPVPYLNAVGVVSLVYLPLSAVGEYAAHARQRQEEDVTAFFADKSSIPRVKLYERTKTPTLDDYAINGAAGAGILAWVLSARIPQVSSVLRAFPAKFDIKRVAGAMTFGCVAGSFTGMAMTSQSYMIARLQRERDVQIAKKVFTDKMNRQPPKWLYMELNSMKTTFDFSTMFKTASPTQMIPGAFTGGPGEGSVEEAMMSGNIVPQPIGSAPHTSYTHDGKRVYSPNRDYVWRPASTEEGIDTLEMHIKELSERRAKLAREAEFLWHEVADREVAYLRDSKQCQDPDEDEPLRLQRKTLEFLNSMHSNVWGDISHLDWIIADSKKMLLQFQSNGTWTPEKGVGYVDPQTYVPEGILEKIQQHKQTTEAITAHMNNMVVLGDENFTRNQREMKENTMATSELLEELESRGRK